MSRNLHGKVALVTGAARGMGHSTAARLAEAGADVVALDLRGLDDTVKAIEAHGRRVVAAEADVTDLDGLRAAVDAGVGTLGRLDIVSANAGIASFATSTVDVDPATWQKILDVNLTGVWHTVRATVPHVISSGDGGSIVIISSAAGARGYAGLGHYVASKHGVVGLMKSFALEFGEHGVRVNSILPGAVGTPMLLDDPTNPMNAEKDEARREAMSSGNALGIPWLDPEDIANAVAFLASDDARYITGVTLPVDAGVLVK